MLRSPSIRYLFWAFYLTIIALQSVLAWQNELFVDEAFYWLEGRFLQFSYTEVPGFVPWLNALSGHFLPTNSFYFRLPYLLAAWSIPWLAFHLATLLSPERDKAYLAAIFSLCLPLLGLVGVLAIADVWILFFSVSAVIFLLRLLISQQPFDALVLGLVLALGVNVHIRFWFVLFIAFMAAIMVWRSQITRLKWLWQLTFPLLIVGFLPIIWFNFQHDFPLLSFQLGERNPWQFQISHLWFFVTQILLTTPLIFWLCLSTLKVTQDNDLKQKKALQFIQYIGIMYWLLYALLGFYSDNLRTNAHWPLLSYLLLLLIAAIQGRTDTPLKKWTIITGFGAHVSFLLGFYVLIHCLPVQSNSHKELISHSIGWQQLSAHVDTIQQPKQLLLADQFMTAAALNYYQVKQSDVYVKSLTHPLNQKHGRQQQLKLMGLLEESTVPENTLLVVEHTALKLTQQISFYQATCRQLNGLNLMSDLSIRQGTKLYYFFHSGSGDCQMPPIVYHQYEQKVHSGWILAPISSHQNIRAEALDGLTKTPLNLIKKPLGTDPLFRELAATDYALYEYQIESEKSIQLKISNTNYSVLTRRYWP